MAAPPNQILQPAQQVLLTKEELEAKDYRTLVNMDNLYSFKKSRKTAKTRKTKDAIIARLLKNGVTHGKFAPQHAAYLHYELTHPIAKALPSGKYLPPDLVEKIYTMKEKMDDKDHEVRFIETIFEPMILHPNTNAFRVTINGNDPLGGFNVRVNLNLGEALLGKHFRTLYSPTFFIKDYSYLAKKFEIGAKQLRDRAQYRDEEGWKRGDYGPQPPFTHTILNSAIYDNYAEFKRRQISKFFVTHLYPTYTLYYIIDRVLIYLEYYVKTSKVNNISQDYADTRLQEGYLPQAQNKPINILKVYIRELNNRLTNLKEYKIILNNDIVKELNARLDAINKLLVNPDPSIPNQANAKFEERVISIIMKPANKRFETRGPIKTIKATNKSIFTKYPAKEDGLNKTVKRPHSARRHSRSKSSSRRLKSK